MIKLFNTYTRKLEDFKPLNKSKVTFYACGPTVYDYAHIGNLRAYIFDDLVRRTLKLNGYKVEEAINITDVGHLVTDADEGEDKMVKAIRREGLDFSVASMMKLAQKYTDEFVKNIRDLNIELPEQMPKATDHVPEMIEIIQGLIDNGYVYETSTAFYFDTSKFPDYGTLGNLDQDELKAGARIDVDPEKKNPFDFSVWMKAVGKNANHVMVWSAPFSKEKGFPGWHIECSAMSMKYLGQTIDIHAGGIDHIKVHHTNEIAQSTAYTNKQFVRYWLHNEFVVLDKGKMSKSAGTFIRLQDLIDKGYDPLAYRYLLLQAHYRSPIMFSYQSLDDAQNGLNNLRDKFLSLGKKSGKVNKEYVQLFTEAMNIDFDSPKALAIFHKALKDKALTDPEKRATLLAFDKVLGLGLADLKQAENKIPEEIQELAERRLLAKKSKDFDGADILRREIFEKGWEIKDTKDGYELKKI